MNNLEKTYQDLPNAFIIFALNQGTKKDNEILHKLDIRKKIIPCLDLYNGKLERSYIIQFYSDDSYLSVIALAQTYNQECIMVCHKNDNSAYFLYLKNNARSKTHYWTLVDNKPINIDGYTQIQDNTYLILKKTGV